MRLVGAVSGESAGSAWTDSNPPRYVVQPGETFSSIAAIYLGDVHLAFALVLINPQILGRDVRPGDVLNMPPEAIANARALGILDQADDGEPSALRQLAFPVFVMASAVGLSWLIMERGR